MGDRRLARWDRLVGIFVFQLRQVEGDAVRERHRAGHGRRPAGEQPGHLGRTLQVALGVGLERQARLVDGGLLADAGEDVLQRAPLRTVIEHVVDRQHRRPRLLRQGVQRRQAHQIAGAVGPGRRQPRAAAEGAGEVGEIGGEGRVQPPRRHDHDQLPLAVLQQIAAGQQALALPPPPLAHRQQPGQPSPGLPVRRVAEHLGRAVDERQPAAGQHPLANLPSLRPGPHHPGQGVAVGDPDRRQPQRLGRQHQLSRMRRPAQEAVVAGGLQLGVTHGAEPGAFRDRGKAARPSFNAKTPRAPRGPCQTSERVGGGGGLVARVARPERGLPAPRR